MKKSTLIFVFVFFILELQASFLIKGYVKEKQGTHIDVLPFATVSVLVGGILMGTTTNDEGFFQLKVPATGSYQLKFSYIGLKEKIENVHVSSHTTEVDVVLTPDEELVLDEVEVSTHAIRSGENMLLLDRKNAAVAVESIGAKQMSLQGVSDAADGVTKVAGISIQQGSQTINVRGLGDRYNTTTLNGLPLPSNHAEFKNINLELFGADVIEYIGVDKVFTSNLYADVAGANINIVSKKHNGDAYLKVGISLGYNLNMRHVDPFYWQDGSDKWGFHITPRPSGAKLPTDYHAFVNSWDLQNVSSHPNLGVGISGGRAFRLGEATLNAFATLGYNNEWNYKQKQERKINGSDDYRNDLRGEIFSYETQTTGMLNLNLLRKKMQLYYNLLAFNSSESNITQLQGYIVDVVGNEETEQAFLRRSEYIRNFVVVQQLLGEYRINRKNSVNWAMAYNTVDNRLPDRRHNVMVGGIQSTDFRLSTNDASNHNRFWSALNEHEAAVNFYYNHQFGNALNKNVDYRGKWIVGFSGRNKYRDFEATQYNHGLDKFQQHPIDIWHVDNFFNNTNFLDGLFTVSTFSENGSNKPSTYAASQVIYAGVSSLEYNLSSKLLLLAGLRAERVVQKIDYNNIETSGHEAFDEFNLFPSLSLRYAVGSKTNIRLATSKTYTLPQFKETAAYLFEGITVSTEGNPELYPSVDYNFDLKWEFFPHAGEVFSLASYAKYIKDPINHFVRNSPTREFTYANTGDWAYVAGVELDMRKHLWKKEQEQKKQALTFSANVSLMYSKQQLSDEKVARETKQNASFFSSTAPLQGAAPLLMNAGMVYSNEWKTGYSLSSSLIYGYTSDKLYLLGSAGKIGNQYDKAYNELNYVLQTTFQRFNFTLSAKNLLNQTRERIQRNTSGDHMVLSYKEGMKFKLSASYRF